LVKLFIKKYLKSNLFQGRSMATFYRTNNRRQGFLLPPNMMDWLDEDDIVHFIVETVETLDLSSFERNPEKESRGRPGLDPRLMVALLLYAYCQGERSSRRIERLCGRDVAYRVVSAQLFPDHSLIARFRKNHEKALGDLFPKVLMMCADAGLVKLGRVALDGTKIKADAALERNRTLSTLREKVATWMSEAEKTDWEEDTLPEDRTTRTHPEVSRRSGSQSQGNRMGEGREKAGPGREGSCRRSFPGSEAQGHPSGSQVPQGEPHRPGKPDHDQPEGKIRAGLQCPDRRDRRTDHSRSRNKRRPRPLKRK
jgi:transposase